MQFVLLRMMICREISAGRTINILTSRLSEVIDQGEDDFHLLLRPTCTIFCQFQRLCHADWIKRAAHVLHWYECNLNVCCTCLECIILNVLAMHLMSLAWRENASNSAIVLTVLVDDG